MVSRSLMTVSPSVTTVNSEKTASTIPNTLSIHWLKVAASLSFCRHPGAVFWCLSSCSRRRKKSRDRSFTARSMSFVSEFFASFFTSFRFLTNALCHAKESTIAEERISLARSSSSRSVLRICKSMTFVSSLIV